jgi:hypothetical protein
MAEDRSFRVAVAILECVCEHGHRASQRFGLSR